MARHRSAATPKRSGTLETRKDADGLAYYRGRIWLQDGTLQPVPIPEAFVCSKPLAREYVTAEQEIEDEGHAFYLAKIAKRTKADADTACAAGETCAAWYQRFMVYRRKTLSAACVKDSFSRWHKWIEPHIGRKPIALVTADDAEAIRDALKDAITAGKLAHRSAGECWIVFTTAMKHASTRRGPPDLRVREAKGNPCTGIDPPPRGASKRRHWNRPAEIAAVLANVDAVPLEWREAIAIGCYLHPRPGELEELRVKDFDLDVGEVHIRRAWDPRAKKVKAPKTAEGVRHVTVPSTLMPLLRRIADSRGPEDLVAPVLKTSTRTNRRAPMFREFLRKSGVDRPELFVDTPTHEMIDFRSLRDTGITWRFLAGDRAEVVQREAGHEDFKTTLNYAKEVSDRRGRFGEPFPPLPPDLGGPPKVLDMPGGHITKSATKPPSGQSQRPESSLASVQRRGTIGPPLRYAPENPTELRESTSADVTKSSSAEQLTTRRHVSDRPIDYRPESRADCTELARIARRVRLLIPNTTGDVRAELEEILAKLEAMLGPAATVTSLASRKLRG